MELCERLPTKALLAWCKGEEKEMSPEEREEAIRMCLRMIRKGEELALYPIVGFVRDRGVEVTEEEMQNVFEEARKIGYH